MRKDMVQNNPEQATTMDDSFASPTQKLRVVFEIEFSNLAADEMDGDFEPGEFTPSEEYEPEEIARILRHGLANEDAQAEMFAGTGVFLKIMGVAVKSASWEK